MNNCNTVVLACETLRQEVELAMATAGCAFPVRWIESGLHAWPQKLHDGVQGMLDELEAQYTTVLMALGFCGNSMVGIRPGDRTMVLPYVPDCIPLFLGSMRARDEIGAFTYFFTEGYLSFEQHILSEYERYRDRHGEQRALRVTKMMLAHYREFAVIDTGAYRVDGVVGRLRSFADLLDIPLRVVPGSLCYFTDLLEGRWGDNRFLVVPPGGEVAFDDALRVGKSQMA